MVGSVPCFAVSRPDRLFPKPFMRLLSLYLGGQIPPPRGLPRCSEVSGGSTEFSPSHAAAGHTVSAPPPWLSYCFMLCPMVGKDSLLGQAHLRTIGHSFLVLPSA